MSKRRTNARLLFGVQKAKEFSYTGQVAECNNCNTKIYVRDIENENTKSRYRKVIEINESNEK